MTVPDITGYRSFSGESEYSNQRILFGLYDGADAAHQHFNLPPDAIDGTNPKPPPFNADTMLPPSMRPFVKNVAEHLQVPIEAVAMISISTLSAAAVGRVLVDGRNGWRQPAFVWTTTTMHSGERKTDVVRIVAEPVRKVERKMIAEHKERVGGYARDKSDLSERVKELKGQLKDAKRGREEAEIKKKLDEAAQRLEDLTNDEPGVVPAMLVEDATVEALSQRLDENGQRLAVLSDEGGIFSLIAGRYSNGVPNMELYLKAYDESPARVDRVVRGAIYLSRPALAIGLLVQPHVLDKAASIPGARDLGLLGRFIFAIPESTLGKRKTDSPPLDLATEADWDRTVHAVLSLPVTEDRQIIEIDDLSHKLLSEFRARLEPHLEPYVGRYAHMSDWAGKLAGKVLRLAALFHLADHQPLSVRISETTMTHAIALGLWALRHAEQVHAHWQTNAAEINPGVVWLTEWIDRKGVDAFTFRDAQQTAKRSGWYALGGSGALDDALCQLVRARMLSSYERADGNGRKQTKGMFLVRPGGRT